MGKMSQHHCPSPTLFPHLQMILVLWSYTSQFIHVSNIEDHILQLLDLLVFFFLLVTFSSIYSAISTSGVSQMRMKKPYWWFSYWSFNLLKFFKVVVTSTHTYLIACMCLYKSRMSLPSGFSLFRIITVSQAVKQVCHFREGKGSQWFHVFLCLCILCFFFRIYNIYVFF